MRVWNCYESEHEEPGATFANEELALEYQRRKVGPGITLIEESTVWEESQFGDLSIYKVSVDRDGKAWHEYPDNGAEHGDMKVVTSKVFIAGQAPRQWIEVHVKAADRNEAKNQALQMVLEAGK